MKKVIGIALVLAATATIAWFTQPPSKNNAESSGKEYRTEQVSTGNISNTVSATGTLSAVDDVIVGAQLSGQIANVFVDFNDSVKAGQLLAQIDPGSFQSKVDQASAQLKRTQADIALQNIAIERAKVAYGQTERDLTRAEALFSQKVISQDQVEDTRTAARLAGIDYQQSQAQLGALQANLAANQATLDQAMIDLGRTEIRSPIDGFVISRTIETGQTVASSLNTPELFKLAKDLSEMDVEAYIDESDIGQIQLDQQVEFSVDAFPDRTFRGSVKQIRRAPQITSGVVSYTVIISANNRTNQLLPGMTANLEIKIDDAKNVMRINNAALRVVSRLETETDSSGDKKTPLERFEALGLTDEQKAALREQLPKKSGLMVGRDADKQQRQKIARVVESILTPEQIKLRDELQSGKVSAGKVMILKNGQPKPVSVLLGISDGQFTQLLKPDLSGEQIITQVKDVTP
ncbi:efflux RND transporter periplasmic adaptor subunit [Parendozoicomonas haliclonae]|uniref:Macrolide export protein MacA n=1 Tax=Parendozoicomonas haliclonae TaxID=1960125 RepID=A0A1X7API1_9GAMM|nr:efflux RND transporter periplasmic adaptor subunit [Parendozoicomonas haliclonae]SMA50214.1 Macrolide export protein MacA [Parendozoicomonas haliclonae]